MAKAPAVEATEKDAGRFQNEKPEVSWRYERGCLVVYCLIFVGLAAQTSILGATLTGLAELYGETDDGATALSESMMGRGAGYLLGTFTTGFAFDKYPTKTHILLFLSIVMLGAATALVPIYPGAGAGPGASPGSGRWLLMLALLFQGTVAGSIDLGGNVLLTRVFASDIQRLNPRMNLLHLAWGVGATLGPLAAIGLGLSSDQLYSTYATIAGVGVILSLPLLMLSSPKIARVEDPPEDINSSSEARRVEQQSLPRPGVAQSIVFLCFFYFLYAGMERIIGEWIAVFATNAPVGLPKETAALTVSVYFGSMSIGRLLAAALTLRGDWAAFFTPARLIGGSLLVALASLLLLAFSGAYNVGGLFVAVTDISLSFSSIYPTACACHLNSRLQDHKLLCLFCAPLGALSDPSHCSHAGH